MAGSGAGQVLHGGSGVSTLVGGSGAGQQLFGDTSTANIFGGTGSGQTLTAGTGDDHLYAGEADGQVLDGGSGNDVLQVGWHLMDGTSDTAYIGTNITFTNLPQGASQSLTSYASPPGGLAPERDANDQWLDDDELHAGDASQGASHAYVMQAGTGNTLIIGGGATTRSTAAAASNTIYGGGGAGNKWMYAGTGATQMYGGGPGDNASPATGTHILYGGSGQDVLYGGDGCNIAANNTGTGLVTPGGDGGDVGVNILAAGVGQHHPLQRRRRERREHPARRQRPGQALRRRRRRRLPGSRQRRRLALWRHGQRRLPVALHPGRPAAVTPDTLVGGFGLTTLRAQARRDRADPNGQLDAGNVNTSSSDNNIDLDCRRRHDRTSSWRR